MTPSPPQGGFRMKCSTCSALLPHPSTPPPPSVSLGGGCGPKGDAAIRVIRVCGFLSLSSLPSRRGFSGKEGPFRSRHAAGNGLEPRVTGLGCGFDPPGPLRHSWPTAGCCQPSCKHRLCTPLGGAPTQMKRMVRSCCAQDMPLRVTP